MIFFSIYFTAPLNTEQLSGEAGINYRDYLNVVTTASASHNQEASGSEIILSNVIDDLMFHCLESLRKATSRYEELEVSEEEKTEQLLKDCGAIGINIAACLMNRSLKIQTSLDIDQTSQVTLKTMKDLRKNFSWKSKPKFFEIMNFNNSMPPYKSSDDEHEDEILINEEVSTPTNNFDRESPKTSQETSKTASQYIPAIYSRTAQFSTCVCI